MLQIRFIQPDDIETVAREARQRFGVGELPIDVEYVLDVKLGMDLVPVHGLRDRISGGDAFAARDWSAIYYDPGPIATRIRYSFAHELGHFLMHKDVIDALPVTEAIDDWAELYANLPADAVGSAETQANMFAAAFLMPEDDVEAGFRAALQELEKQRRQAIDAGLPRRAYVPSILDRIATKLAPDFDVSLETMAYRLRNLDVGDRIP